MHEQMGADRDRTLLVPGPLVSIRPHLAEGERPFPLPLAPSLQVETPLGLGMFVDEAECEPAILTASSSM